jgi:hypothetical protein
MSLRGRLRALEVATRVDDAEVVAALARRWDELPAHVKTPAQLVGRRGTGCEGTHGVFPRCNFACEPCYHSSDANHVRVDGPHTVASVDAQMALLRSERGPGQYAQLIGGEVSLLEPEDHAAALEAMVRHGRVPMSFTHGDFEDNYLRRLALRGNGTRRFEHLSFAVHIDSTMIGRRGARRVSMESDLNEHRRRFCEMFDRLRREHGVSSYLAHNMTVTPANLDQVPGVIRHARRMGFRMFSFQPAAYVGDESRWHDEYRSITDDDVWAQIEQGAGTRLPYKAIQFGDLRCNRVVWGLWCGDRYVPLLDDADPADLAARDLFFAAFPRNFTFCSRPVMLARVARAIARRPALIPTALSWAGRFARRAGGVRALREVVCHGVRPMTFVMHSFIDARHVGEAWDLNRQGRVSEDTVIRSAQERLHACVYTMAHPESGELVPACVQHSVLDPIENRQLVQLLPRRVASRPPGSTGVGG